MHELAVYFHVHDGGLFFSLQPHLRQTVEQRKPYGWIDMYQPTRSLIIASPPPPPSPVLNGSNISLVL